MSAENVGAARDSIEAWGEGDRDRHRSSFADDAVLVEHGTGRQASGGDAIAELHFGWKTAIPDGHGEIGNVVDGDDHVVIEVVWKGTHGGPLQTPDGGTIPATDRPISVPASMVLTMRDGKITRMTHYFDLMTLLKQLGVA